MRGGLDGRMVFFGVGDSLLRLEQFQSLQIALAGTVPKCGPHPHGLDPRIQILVRAAVGGGPPGVGQILAVGCQARKRLFLGRDGFQERIVRLGEIGQTVAPIRLLQAKVQPDDKIRRWIAGRIGQGFCAIFTSSASF